MKPKDLIHETGPFDIIGDVHGCLDELNTLIDTLGYVRNGGGSTISHPDNRKMVFVGDYVDRGPYSPDALLHVMWLVSQGIAYGVAGNHDDKFRRYLLGRDIKPAHGLAETIARTEEVFADRKEDMLEFLNNLPYHLILDNGNLVVAHAGLEEHLHGLDNDRVKSFCLYGKTTGEKDEHGLPVRLPWQEDYIGDAYVVYGHTPFLAVQVCRRCYNIDTACAFGGKLTALRYPEMEILQVNAQRVYAESSRPLT